MPENNRPAGARGDTTLLLGTRKGLIVYACDGGAWRFAAEHHPGVPVSLAIADPRSGRWWAALDHGHWGQKLHYSDDRGASWVEVPAPAYPEGATLKDGAPATLENIWAIAPGGADEPEVLYLGTNPGGLFRSEDGGGSFTLVDGLWDHPSRLGWFGGGRDTPGIHSVLVDPRDSRRLLVAVSCAGVFESLDRGETWAPRNRGLSAPFLPEPDAEVGHDPHLLAWSPARPERLWQQNHHGVYRSDDGAASWVEVSAPEQGVFFGFPVAVDSRDPDRAWVIPAKSDEVRAAIGGQLRVCRTEDGGRSWTSFGEGLPQRACYDLVYRHALAQREETLAFGSTTGNLFVSDDGGERWASLAHHLPPIYSVAFA